MGKGTPENLAKWQATLTPEEQREICKRAARISKQKRKERKELADYLIACLETKTPTGTVAGDLALSLINEALDGNVSAWQTIRDTIGEKPKEQIELDSSGTINITIGNDGEH